MPEINRRKVGQALLWRDVAVFTRLRIACCFPRPPGAGPGVREDSWVAQIANNSVVAIYGG